MPPVKRDRMSFRIEAIVGNVMTNKKRAVVADATHDDEEPIHPLVRLPSMYVPRFPSNATTLSAPSSAAITVCLRQSSALSGERSECDYDHRYEFLKAEVEDLIEEIYDLYDKIADVKFKHLQAEADALVVKSHDLQQKLIAAVSASF